jgi:hypothetical protein
VFAVLAASEDAGFLSAFSYPICDYIVSHPADNYAHRMIIPLANYPLKIMELIGLVPEYPVLLSSLLCVLKRIPSSQSHFDILDALCTTVVELISVSPISDPLLHDVSALLKLVNERTALEISELKSTVKFSNIRRLLSTVEELNSDECVAALSVNYMPDYNSLYCALAPKYCPVILRVICGNVSPVRWSIPIFASFPNSWRTVIFFAMVVEESLIAILPHILPQIPEDEVVTVVRSVITVLSYDDKSDRRPFCRFIEAVVRTKLPVFQSEKAVSLFTSMFHQLHISCYGVLNFICEYVECYPNANVSAFQQPFMSAVGDVKSSPDEIPRLINLLCGKDLSVLTAIYGSKGIASLVKTLVLCEKTNVEVCKLVSRFSVLEESYPWTDLVMTILFEPKLFGLGREYLTEFARAIAVVAKSSGKFVQQFFDLLVQRKEVLGTRKMRILSFTVFACELDTFANRQQNINAILTRSLSAEGAPEISEFLTFSLFMRVLFVRVSVKSIEGLCSILVSELSGALESSNEELRTEAVKLLKAARMAIPETFHLWEFAFLPDLITFPDGGDSDCPWPMVKENGDSLLYLNRERFDLMVYEEGLMDEFIGDVT